MASANEFSFKMALIPGLCDVYANGELKTNVQSRIVFVDSEASLANIGNYEIGTFAATLGCEKVWQKTANGWTPVC